MWFPDDVVVSLGVDGLGGIFNDMKIVAAAAIIEDGKLLVARRGKGQNMEGFWELPGGKVEAGEDPRSCLIREIAEELGIGISVHEEIGRSAIEGDVGSMTLVAFIAHVIEGHLSLSVHSEIRWILPQEVDSMAFCPPDIPIVGSVLELMKGRK